jgi:hypothetical protein
MSDNKFVLVPVDEAKALIEELETMTVPDILLKQVKHLGKIAGFLRTCIAAAPQAAPMPDERQFILQVLLCVLQNDVEALQVMHHERSEELSVAYAALSAAPVSEQP